MFNASKYQIVRQQLSDEQKIDAVLGLNELIDDPENKVTEDQLKRSGKDLIFKYTDHINFIWKVDDCSAYTGKIYYQSAAESRLQWLQPTSIIEIKHLVQLEDLVADEEKSNYQASLLMQSIFMASSLTGFWLVLLLSSFSSISLGLVPVVLTSLLFMIIGCSSFGIALKLYLNRVDYQKMQSKMANTCEY